MRPDAWAGVTLSLLFFLAGPCAGQTAWQPSPGHAQMPIWPGVVHDAQRGEGPEESGTVVDGVGSQKLVAGRPGGDVARDDRDDFEIGLSAPENGVLLTLAEQQFDVFVTGGRRAGERPLR